MVIGRIVPTVGRVIAVLRRIQERIERSCERLGLSYPWWIPAYTTMACIGITVAAFAQRGAAIGEPVIIAALVVTLAPTLTWSVAGWLAPPWIEAVFSSAAVALYLTHPVEPDLA